MYYFVSLSIERFYSDTLVREEPKLADQPLIVHHDKHVLDLNPVAEASGARVGMALSEAKALLRGGCFVRWEEEAYRDAQEAWLQLCTEFTDTIEPDRQHSAYLDFSLHPEIDSLVWSLQKKLFEELGWKCRTGVACTKWIAKVAEMVNGDGELPCPYIEPCTHPIRFLAGLPTRYLLPVPEVDRMRLRFLGYHKIGEVAAVPLPALREQFGEEGLLVFQAAHGGVQQCVRAEFPKGSVASRFRFESAVDNTESLDEGMREVAKKLSENLRARDLQGNQLELAFEGEEGQIWKSQRKFIKPMQSSKAIFMGMKMIESQGRGEQALGLGPSALGEGRGERVVGRGDGSALGLGPRALGEGRDGLALGLGPSALGEGRDGLALGLGPSALGEGRGDGSALGIGPRALGEGRDGLALGLEPSALGEGRGDGSALGIGPRALGTESHPQSMLSSNLSPNTSLAPNAQGPKPKAVPLPNTQHPTPNTPPSPNAQGPKPKAVPLPNTQHPTPNSSPAPNAQSPMPKASPFPNTQHPTPNASPAPKAQSPMPKACPPLPSTPYPLPSTIPATITEIRARMTNLQSSECFQRELSGAHSAAERSSSTAAAFQHIRTVFGDHAIEVAGQLKEPRRKQLLRFWKDATGWS